MIAPATFRERLPSAIAAIALQAGLLALLVLSFQVVRHISQEQEHFITLPPLAQPLPQQKAPPLAGRKPSTASPLQPVPPAPPPAWASPGFTLEGIGDSGGAGAGIRLARPPNLMDCKPENYANLNASDRKACSRPEDMARRDPNAVPLNPGKPVTNAPIWQAEIDRRNAPAVIPGGNPLGALFTLLGNPGAFLDKRNYSYAAPGNSGEEKVDGAEATHRLWSQPPQCAAGMDDTMRRVCQANAAATYNIGGGEVYRDHPHVSDAAFQKARAAAQARTQSLYGRPVLASGASKGGGNEKSGISGSTSGSLGTAAVGGASPGR
jgi:hypothetical protein